MYGRAVEKRAYNSYPSDFAAEHYTYDIDGRCTGYTDANQNTGSNGYTEKYTYDLLGRLISAVDANDIVTETNYDSFDNITSQKVGGKPLFEKSYDNEGKLTSDTDPLGNAENYSYDNLGRTLNITKRNGVRVSYEYDEAGNISRNTMLNTAGGVENRSMNITPGNTDRIYEISYTATEKGYEGLLHGENMQSISPSGRILSATYSSNIANASGKKFGSRNEYEYDSMGNTVLAYSGTKVNARYIGAYTRYGYNKDRITSVQLDGEKSANEDKALYEFYADGKLKSVIMPLSYGTELKSEYEYNGYGELVTLTNSKGGNIIEKYEYTYDLNGNDFKNCISDKDYYLLFEEIKAFPQKKTVVEISTFKDYLSSDCELIILCYDTVSIEVYSKNTDILYSIKTNCLNNDFENVEEIYENTKFHEIMYVR